MKLKYTLSRDMASGQLSIKEFGELDKDIMSPLCEERFDDETVRAAMAEGTAALVEALRSDNLYPPSVHAVKIAETVAAMYDTDSQTEEIFFDDKKMLAKEQEEAEAYDDDIKEDVDLDVDDDTDELDGLLDDSDLKIKSTTSALKIADDDSVDLEEDT